LSDRGRIVPPTTTKSVLTSTTGQPRVRTRPRPDCHLCEGSGDLLYEGLTDRIFGAPGVWSFRRCSGCGLVWLDPAPLEGDTLELYRDYYTHDDPSRPPPEVQSGLFRRTLRRSYHALLQLTPIWRERQRIRLMYLDEATPGRLLDVGCGNGDRMAEFEARGWQVQGQEIDPTAAGQARARGLRVHLGDLESSGFAPESFDAVTANHVIEHVHAPVALLRECRRLLKPGGTLIVVTPNVESHGHRRFEAAWRGLEPPRHLQIFSPGTLGAVASRAGFDRVTVRTSAANAQSIAIESAPTSRVRPDPAGTAPPLLAYPRAGWVQLSAWLDWRRHPDRGEECILEATR